MFPFLCTMSTKNNVLCFSDNKGDYSIILKPRVGLVVCYKMCLFCDELWPLRLDSEEYFKTTDGIRALQKIKTEDNRVYAELKKIQTLAEKHNISRENVLLLDCATSAHTCDELTYLITEGFDRNLKFQNFRSNSLWPGLKNTSGLHLTDCFLDEIWYENRCVEAA